MATSLPCSREGHEAASCISAEVCVLCACNALRSDGLTVHKRRVGAQLLAALTHCNVGQARSQPQLLAQLLHLFLRMISRAFPCFLHYIVAWILRHPCLCYAELAGNPDDSELAAVSLNCMYMAFLG
jgi:hypothetical protein